MKKLFICSLLLFSEVFSSDVQNSADVANVTSGDDFIELSEPYKIIGGAYVGLGVGLASIKHKLNANKITGGRKEPVSLHNSANQYDIVLIAGFGSAFYKNYYAGIEFSIFRRFCEKTKFVNEEAIGLQHTSGIGFDMDVRIGYLLPESGNLIYGTVGFARIVGAVTFRQIDGQQGWKQGTNGHHKVSFGSFYPTFGLGMEHKIDDTWNVRGDVRMSLTSKDDGKRYRINGNNWEFDVRPNKFAIRLSVTRTI
ncbi:MAG: hypothetical protein LBB29_03060 [Holosporaceae bacterium]|jgi:hypothetical protein|nr:hypothetical protein [Holosporaceae bacterium]